MKYLLSLSKGTYEHNNNDCEEIYDYASRLGSNNMHIVCHMLYIYIKYHENAVYAPFDYPSLWNNVINFHSIFFLRFLFKNVISFMYIRRFQSIILQNSKFDTTFNVVSNFRICLFFVFFFFGENVNSTERSVWET